MREKIDYKFSYDIMRKTPRARTMSSNNDAAFAITLIIVVLVVIVACMVGTWYIKKIYKTEYQHRRD